MERDALIMNKILAAAYQLRSSSWITAHTIRHHLDETLSICELKQYLGVLCDKGLLKKGRWSWGDLSRKNVPGCSRAGTNPPRSDLYRITDLGIKSVQAKGRKDTRIAAFKRLTAKG